MKTENPDEYQALFELAGDQHDHVLGSCPLALAQAGIFIVRIQCSFAEYVELYKTERLSDSVPELFVQVEDSGLSLSHQERGR